MLMVNVAITSCNKAPDFDCENVTITLINDTSMDISDFQISNHSLANNEVDIEIEIIPKLTSGSVSDPICFSSLMVENNTPLVYFQGVVGEDTIQSMTYFGWVSGQAFLSPTGEFELTLFDDECIEDFICYNAQF